MAMLLNIFLHLSREFFYVLFYFCLFLSKQTCCYHFILLNFLVYFFSYHLVLCKSLFLCFPPLTTLSWWLSALDVIKLLYCECEIVAGVMGNFCFCFKRKFLLLASLLYYNHYSLIFIENRKKRIMIDKTDTSFF